MTGQDLRALHLGWVETFLRCHNKDLPQLWLTGQSHYAPGGFAFVVVDGVEDDTPRRRAIRSEAAEMLVRLGHPVELQSRRDVYNIDPERPLSRHEEMQMLSALHSALSSR